MSAARADAERHAQATLRADQTLRSRSDAALADLEGIAHGQYTLVEHKAYRVAYADEYRRVRAGHALAAETSLQASALVVPAREKALGS